MVPPRSIKYCVPVITLKFMRGGQVIWVDIDARTGEVVGRSGR